MLDIHFVRQNPDAVIKNLERRRCKEMLPCVKDLLKKDAEWRKTLQQTEQLRKRRNSISREINEAKKAGKPAANLLKEAKSLPGNIKKNETKMDKLKEKITTYLMRLPNILHESVPYGKDENDNIPVKEWGKKPKFSFPIKHHGQLAVALGGADFERAVKISGTGFFFLQNEIALMDLALQRMAIDILLKKGHSLTLPPHLMRRKPYEGTVSLDDFEDVMYKAENEDLYMIATSEHPMAAMYMGEMLKEQQLPIKLCGLSHCFRKEIGKHGLDERGLFRVHQFTKVEQFIFSTPEGSWEHFEEIARNAEELLEALEIPYQRTNVCTGDIGIIAAKKFDVNAWSPREEKYIELMSCSNCTDYQANRLGIRYLTRKGEKKVVHTLNNTMLATSRALRIILETCQTADGSLKVPKALQPYMGGIKEIRPKQTP